MQAALKSFDLLQTQKVICDEHVSLITKAVRETAQLMQGVINVMPNHNKT